MRLRSFIRNEDGVSLTEYLVLLGLLTAGTITGTVSFGVSLSDAWRSASNVIPTLSASVSSASDADADADADAPVVAAAVQEPQAESPAPAAANNPPAVAAAAPAVVDTSDCPSPKANANAFKNKPHCPRG